MRALGFAYKEMSLYDESQEAAVALEEEEEINVSEYTIHVLPVWKWMLKTLYLSPKQ